MYLPSQLRSGQPPCEELMMPYMAPSESQKLSFFWSSLSAPFSATYLEMDPSSPAPSTTSTITGRSLRAKGDTPQENHA